MWAQETSRRGKKKKKKALVTHTKKARIYAPGGRKGVLGKRRGWGKILERERERDTSNANVFTKLGIERIFHNLNEGLYQKPSVTITINSR